MLRLTLESMSSWLSAALLLQGCSAYVSQPRANDATCERTTVAILGAGVAGITAAQALSNASVTDFIILEYNDVVGGRAAHTTFGKKPDGSPYVIELGANWIQDIPSKDGPANPIWTLANKYNVTNTYSNYSSILTYDESGFNDYSALIDEYDEVAGIVDENAGYLISQNLQDQTGRTGLAVAGWRPELTEMKKQAAEWWGWDFEAAYPPDESSMIFNYAGSNISYDLHDNFVFDQRGFNIFVRGEASTFLRPNDKRLRLNTVVTNISYSSNGVTIHNNDGSCISAAYAICTFGLGVLQNDVVSFQPELPTWKQTAIQSFDMATYTKIFLQFNETFWPKDSQYFLYASPDRRGYYPLFQSLSTPGFLPESNIIFVTVVDDESYRVENQSDEETKEEILEVLRQMFPNVSVPEPTAFLYPRWTKTPWTHGSYSNWPPGVTLERHQNLRANVQRLWFAGEALSSQYFGFLHGAWFSGKEMGERIAGLLGKGCAAAKEQGPGACGEEVHYEEIHGTSPLADWSAANGWPTNPLGDGHEYPPK